MRARVRHLAVACALSGVGLAVAAGRLLADPASRLSRFVDRQVLPHGVTR